MKELTVKSLEKIEAVAFNGSTEFKLKPVVPPQEAKQCAVNFVEVEPGGTAFGYHWHEMNEEVFYIISGSGTVKTANGNLAVKAGDAITFPAGPAGAHVISNASQTEKLVYIDFDTSNPCEIVHFPEMKKVMPLGPFSHGMYDEQE